MAISPQNPRLAVWVYDDSAAAYVDHSAEARSSGGTAFSIFEDAADYLYIGVEDRFDMAIFFLTTLGAVGDRTWSYYDGNSWDTFSPGLEYAFDINGAERFDRLINWRKLLISSTSPHTAAPPDQIARYWVRCTVASVTQAPSVQRMVVREYASYASASDVANILQIGKDFDDTTIPSRRTVEDYIHAAQSKLDYLTRKSWRPNIAVEEEHEFNRAGMQLVRNYATDIFKLEIWTGSDYETKTQGRNQEYFLVQNTNMVHYARFFILPARIQAYGAAMWGWGFGEFSFPVRVTYLYGSNIYSDEREGGLVNMITRRMAAIDVLQNTDYTVLFPSGTDKIGFERKVDLWTATIEEDIESLKSWETF